MDIPKKFLHDRLILSLVTLMSILMVVGISLVFLRFDVSKNPTTIVAYHPNISGSSYQSGKPIDIYSLAAFMLITSVAAIFLSSKVYTVRHSISYFVLSSAAFLLIMAIVVSYALISLQ
jgi:hypothetical protein